MAVHLRYRRLSETGTDVEYTLSRAEDDVTDGRYVVWQGRTYRGDVTPRTRRTSSARRRDAMVEPASLPDDVYVEWRGRTYPGDVDTPTTVVVYSETAEDGEFSPTVSGRFERVVPAAEATMFELYTTARWRGAPFAVRRPCPDDRVLLYVLGTSEQEARELGLTSSEPTVYTTSVPESELTDVVQHRTEIDLTRRVT